MGTSKLWVDFVDFVGTSCLLLFVVFILLFKVCVVLISFAVCFVVFDSFVFVIVNWIVLPLLIFPCCCLGFRTTYAENKTNGQEHETRNNTVRATVSKTNNKTNRNNEALFPRSDFK